MGMDIYAYVGYGFVIKEAEGEQDPLFDAMDELEGIELPSNENYPLESYTLTEILYDTFKGVTILTFGGEGYETVVLVASESTATNGSWSVEPLTISEIDPKWAKLLSNACEKMGLEYKKPEWLFGAYYSH